MADFNDDIFDKDKYADNSDIGESGYKPPFTKKADLESLDEAEKILEEEIDINPYFNELRSIVISKPAPASLHEDDVEVFDDDTIAALNNSPEGRRSNDKLRREQEEIERAKNVKKDRVFRHLKDDEEAARQKKEKKQKPVVEKPTRKERKKAKAILAMSSYDSHFSLDENKKKSKKELKAEEKQRQEEMKRSLKENKQKSQTFTESPDRAEKDEKIREEVLGIAPVRAKTEDAASETLEQTSASFDFAPVYKPKEEQSAVSDERVREVEQNPVGAARAMDLNGESLEDLAYNNMFVPAEIVYDEMGNPDIVQTLNVAVFDRGGDGVALGEIDMNAKIVHRDENGVPYEEVDAPVGDEVIASNNEQEPDIEKLQNLAEGVGQDQNADETGQSVEDESVTDNLAEDLPKTEQAESELPESDGGAEPFATLSEDETVDFVPLAEAPVEELVTTTVNETEDKEPETENADGNLYEEQTFDTAPSDDRPLHTAESVADKVAEQAYGVEDEPVKVFEERSFAAFEPVSEGDKTEEEKESDAVVNAEAQTYGAVEDASLKKEEEPKEQSVNYAEAFASPVDNGVEAHDEVLASFRDEVEGYNDKFKDINKDAKSSTDSESVSSDLTKTVDSQAMEQEAEKERDTSNVTGGISSYDYEQIEKPSEKKDVRELYLDDSKHVPTTSEASEHIERLMAQEDDGTNWANAGDKVDENGIVEAPTLAKLAKLPLIIDYFISLNLKRESYVKIANFLTMAHKKFENSPENLQYVKICIKKIIPCLMVK